MITLAIESYFSEGAQHWRSRPQWVISRDFYEMWEKVCQPKSFFLESPSLSIGGKSVQLRDFEGETVGFYSWDGARNCAVMTIESTDWDAVIPLHFSTREGSAVIGEPEYVYHEASGLSHGERLEVMYDVVSSLKRRRNFTRMAILRLSPDEYLRALDDIERYYEEKTIRTLRRLPHEEMLKLVAEALEDTPREEQEAESDIIEYQARDAKNKAVGDTFGSSLNVGDLTEKSGATFPVYPQTRFMINEELRCIAEARKQVTEYEKMCKIEFREVEVIDETSDNRGEYGIKFRVRPDLPVVEGDTLTVFGTSNDQEGTLMVDIYDGMMICGRMRFDDRAAGIEQLSDALWALPVPSSAGYLAEAMEHLADTVMRGGTSLSPATEAILGLKQVDYHRAAVKDAPPQLDLSQSKAWAESVDERNPVVLVQGPPGTGKTSVLAEVLRTLVSQGARLMVAAPSNAAVDNLIRRVIDLPVLRIARQKDYVAPDIGQKFWEGEIDNIRRFVERIKQFNGGAIFAGTQVSLMKSQIISDEIEARGRFNAVVFDEAGMTRIEELILCADMGNRAILFGDHRQLLPFPLPQELMYRLKRQYGGMPRRLSSMLERSALEWLCEARGFPTMLLENCYRCQNPRLIRFSSTLFYNAAVRTHSRAEYYRLPPHERARLYPPSTLSLYNTSRLPPKIRTERVVYEGLKPGIENRLEAEVCAKIVEELAQRHPLAQITVIVPYRRQVRLIRHCLNKRRERSQLLGRVGKGEWEIFLSMRISTVDSFQGGESDAVIISYVRSNEEHGVGFVDEPNRINVAHTRCRRELIVIGDFKCLKEGGGGRIFNRMERAFARDGKVIDMSMDTLSKWGIFIPNGNNNRSKKPIKNGKNNKNGFNKFNKNNQNPRPNAPNSNPRPSRPGGTQPAQTGERPPEKKAENGSFSSGNHNMKKPFNPNHPGFQPRPPKAEGDGNSNGPRPWQKPRPFLKPLPPPAPKPPSEPPVTQVYSTFATPAKDPPRRGRPPKSVSENDLPPKPAGRRGRPKKVKTESDLIPKIPKKRGRPPKIKVEPLSPPKKRGRPRKIVLDLVKEPKKRGRPPKVTAPILTAPKKRGRPPKPVLLSPPKKRGRPAKIKVDKPKRPRGRPPKSAIVKSLRGRPRKNAVSTGD